MKELTQNQPDIFQDMTNRLKHIQESIKKMGKSYSEITPEKDIKTRFEDVLGIDEFKSELEEIVDFLKNPEKYHKAGAIIPKGV